MGAMAAHHERFNHASAERSNASHAESIAAHSVTASALRMASSSSARLGGHQGANGASWSGFGVSGFGCMPISSAARLRT